LLRGEDASVVSEALRQKRGWTGELTARKEDAATFDVLLSANLVAEDNGHPVCMMFAFVDNTEQNRLREDLRFWIGETMRTQEEERRRIARELHDETIQDLATLSLEIQSIGKFNKGLSDDVLGGLEEIRRRVNLIMQGVRRFCRDLRPEVLDHLGLVPALDLLAKELEREGITTQIEVSGDPPSINKEGDLAIFRVVQEALTNIRKHSKATKVTIIIEFSASRVSLIISDNGCGFHAPNMVSKLAGKGKLGLFGMGERARLLGGSLGVKSEPGRGTTLTLELPTRRTPARAEGSSRLD
jgi:two-component system, NarL family, sensor histidine kinase DegS